MLSRERVAGAIVVLATLLVAAASAAAQSAGERARANSHARRGAALYDTQRFDDAIVEFERAYELVNSPVLLYNIAQALRQLDRACEALRYYQLFLARTPDVPLASAVRNLVPDVQTACDLKQQRPTDVTDRPPMPSPDAPSPEETAVPPAGAAVADGADGADPGDGESAGADLDADVDAAAAITDDDAGSRLRLAVALTGGQLGTGGAAQAPFGVAATAMVRLPIHQLELGATVAPASFAWAAAGRRGTSSVTNVVATIGRVVRRGSVLVRADGGLGVAVLGGLATGNPMLEPGRGAASAAAVPQLWASAAVERGLGGGWLLHGGAAVGLGAAVEPIAGSVVSQITLQLGVGYRP